MTAEAWLLLIPVVAFERGLFAAGISVSHVLFNTILSRIAAFAKSDCFHIDEIGRAHV